MSEFIVGLTGGIGSGKTTVANFFAELGIDIVDADIVAREVVEPGSPALIQIAKYFGPEFINDQGELERSLLRTRVFSSAKDKTWLNELLHPLIRKTMFDQLAKSAGPYSLLVAPLLIENGLHKLVDTVLVVDVSEATQLARTVKRDPSSADEVKRIIGSQIARDKRLKAADEIINNEKADLKLIQQEVKKLHHKFLRLAQD